MTGDLAVDTASCGLVFRGRADDQINLLGFRVEPAEVEGALRTLGAVTDAVVRARPAPDGGQVLTAYVVWRPGQRLPDSEVRDRLGAVLPAYMVPSVLVALPALPLTANGKLDAAALDTAPRLPAAAGAPARATRLTATQSLVSGVWADILGVPPPDIDTPFFDLGGTSFSLLTLNARLSRELGRDLPTAWMFEHPTIRSLAHRLDEGEHGAGDGTGSGRAQRRRTGTRRLQARNREQM